MSPLPRPKPIIPWWQVGALFLLCAAGIALLMPDDAQLVEDLLRDRKIPEARRAFEKIPARVRAREENRFRLLELKLARSESAPQDRAAHERYWQQAVTAWRSSRFDPALFAELLPIVPSLPDPAAAWRIIATTLGAAPAGQRQELAVSFSRAALAAAQPAAAAEMFSAAFPVAGRTVEQRLELSRLWQLAGRPTDALAALYGSTEPAVQTGRVALLRALNRNREALAVLLQRLEANPPLAADAALTEDIATMALQAGTPADALPAYQRFVAAHPDDLEAVRRFRALLLAAGRAPAAVEIAYRAAALSRRAAEDVRELGRILEWTNQPNAAFDAWLELARTGDAAALDRLIALNPGLLRDADLARVLAPLVPVPGRDDFTLILARLNVTLGRYDLARHGYAAFLSRNPDAEVMRELGRLERDLYRFAEAEATLARAAALRPADLSLRREIAECRVQQGRYDEALALYAALAGESTAEDVIGPLARLAESLGRFDAFARGLQRRIEAAAVPTERDFLLLAYAHELAADRAQRHAALVAGLRRYPQSNDLRLQLAYALAAQRDYRAAQETLAAHTALREEAAAAALFLDLLRLNNDTAGERDFLSRPLAPSVLADDEVLERIARAREALRDYPEATRLWRQLLARHPSDFPAAAELARVLLAQGQTAEARRLLAPFLRAPTPAVLKLAADVATTAGDHRAAEKYQLAYLETVRSAPATDWGALGDIRLARGDRSGAKQAYAEALRRAQAELRGKGVAR